MGIGAYLSMFYRIILNKNNKIVSISFYALSISLITYLYFKNFIFKPLDMWFIGGFLTLANALIQYMGYKYNQLLEVNDSTNEFIDELSMLLCLIEGEQVIYMNKNMKLLTNISKPIAASELPKIFDSHPKLSIAINKSLELDSYTSKFQLGDSQCKLVSKKLPNNHKFICLTNIEDNKDELLTEVVNRFTFGLAIVDQDNQVIFTNKQADHILSRPYIGHHLKDIPELQKSLINKKKQYFTVSSAYLLNQQYKFFKIDKQNPSINSILDECPLGILVIDKEQKVIEFNQYLRKNLIIELNKASDLIDPGQRKAFQEYIDEFIKHRKPLEPSLFSTVYKKIVSAHIKVANGKYIVYLFDDQTELYNHFVHKQRVYMVGESASAIIHDCNNIIMNIVSLLDLMLDNYPNEDKLRCLKHNANSLASLIKQILGLTTSSVDQTMEDLDLNVEVRGFLENLGSHTPIQVYTSPNNPHVYFNRINLEQILMNLLNNANYAIQKANRTPQIQINISTCRIPKFTTENCFQISSGDYAQITVEDNGCGISTQHIKSIFNPYFTTKHKEGSGLGLFSVATILKRHKGFVRVKSNIDHGTRFIIHIPIINNVHDGAQILFVEDNETIRQIMSKNLQSKYRLVFANDYTEALKKISLMDHIDLLVTDIYLPDQNSGIDVYNQVKLKFGTVNTLFVSGYDKGAIHIPNTHFLQKPFSITELKSKIKTILDEQN